MTHSTGSRWYWAPTDCGPSGYHLSIVYRPLARRRSASGVQAIVWPAASVRVCECNALSSARVGLLAANILADLAAELPALPTGFWDRQPKRTPGRLRRVLGEPVFQRYRSDGQTVKNTPSPPICRRASPRIDAAKRRKRPDLPPNEVEIPAMLIHCQPEPVSG